jgi:predicted transposase YbfD/YdcC
VAVEEKSHEITALPAFLTVLEWAGGRVTIDARGTQPELATTLVEQEADDVLALQGQQGTW